MVAGVLEVFIQSFIHLFNSFINTIYWVKPNLRGLKSVSAVFIWSLEYVHHFVGLELDDLAYICVNNKMTKTFNS